MDLGDGSRGDGAIVERVEQRLHRRAEFDGDRRPRLFRWKGRQAIAKPRQIGGGSRADQIGPGGKRLTQFDETGAQRHSGVGERLPETLFRRAAPRQQPHRARQPRRRRADSFERRKRIVPRQHARHPRQTPEIEKSARDIRPASRNATGRSRPTATATAPRRSPRGRAPPTTLPAAGSDGCFRQDIRKPRDRRRPPRPASGSHGATRPRRPARARGGDRRAELQTDEAPAGFQHPRGLRQRLVDPRHVADAEAHDDGVERRVGERQRLRVGATPDGPVRGACGAPPPAFAEHRRVGVAHRRETRPPAQPKGEVSRPAGEIEHPRARPQPERRHRLAPPQAMRAETHEVVHEVVGPRDRCEHGLDAPPPAVGAARIACVHAGDHSPPAPPPATAVDGGGAAGVRTARRSARRSGPEHVLRNPARARTRPLSRRRRPALQPPLPTPNHGLPLRP